MKKKSLFVRIISKIFLKETTIKKDGTEVKGLTLIGYILIIITVVGGLAFLEWCGVIDDLVVAFGKKPAVHGGMR